MSEEKVNRDVLNKLLRQRRLQVNNAKKESFPLVVILLGEKEMKTRKLIASLRTLLDTQKKKPQS